MGDSVGQVDVLADIEVAVRLVDYLVAGLIVREVDWVVVDLIGWLATS